MQSKVLQNKIHTLSNTRFKIVREVREAADPNYPEYALYEDDVEQDRSNSLDEIRRSFDKRYAGYIKICGG